MSNLRMICFFLCCLPQMLIAQTEAESSTAALDVRRDSGKDHVKHSFFTGDRVKVGLRDSTPKVKGRITAVRDSSITVAFQTIPLNEIVSIKGPPDSGTLWAGNLMVLLSLASGFGGWIFLRAMIRKSPDNWWQWTLVALGLLLTVFLLPIFFLLALICWEFASHKYLIGKGNYLRVRHWEEDAAPPEPMR